MAVFCPCSKSTVRTLHSLKNGAPGEIRTPDHQVRSLVLYPTELRAHTLNLRPGDYRCEALAPSREAELFRYPTCASTVLCIFFSRIRNTRCKQLFERVS